MRYRKTVLLRIAPLLLVTPMLSVTVFVGDAHAQVVSASLVAAPLDSNAGGYGSPPSASGSAGPVVPQAAGQSCSGWWLNSVANVDFQETDLGGTARAVAWGFFLTNQARSYLGSIVTVSMPFAYVNGASINPPYSSHSESVYYNFHSSLSGLRAGETLTLYWLLNSDSQSGHGAYRYITCRV